MLQGLERQGCRLQTAGWHAQHSAAHCGHVVHAAVRVLMTCELKVSARPPLAHAQTYEGGLGGEPGNEAHGGYTFCGVAALALAGPQYIAQTLNVPRLVHWLVHRQVGHRSPGAGGRVGAGLCHQATGLGMAVPYG